MDAPANEQQAESLNEALAAEFENMEAGEESSVDEEEFEGEEDVEETTVSEEESEEESEEADEESPPEETSEEVEEVFNEAAPERWPDEIKSVYNSLPPEGRKAMLEGIYKPMQASYTRATQELRERQKAIEPMLEAMNEYRGDFERMGMNPQEAFRRQMAWASHLAKVGPEQGLKDMQAAYGLNKQEDGQQEEEYLTPMERAMKTRLDALEQRYGQDQQAMQQREQAEHERAMQAQYEEAQRGLYDFINEQKDGKPAHPHMEAVAPAISGLLRGGLIPARDDYGQPIPIRNQLEQAYKMACDMNPSIRQARTTGQTRQVAKAKAAESVGVVAKSPASQTRVPNKPLASDLEEMFDSLDRRTG